MTDREAALRSYGTRADPRHVAPIFDTAVETILTIPKFAASSDKHLFRILLLFGAWTYQREGFFDPKTHLDDPRIDYFVEQGLPFRNNASKSTSVSALRRIRQHLDTGERSTTRHGTRKPTLQPHTELEWARFEAAAAHLGDTYVGASFRTALDLTGHAGLRSDEVMKADGTWVHVNGTAVTITAVNSYGAVREVPVIGAAATRLARLAGTPQYLVLPNRLSSRHNISAYLLGYVNDYASNGAAGYQSTRARHRWLSQLAQTPLPLATLCAVADINPGSKLPTDLLVHLPRPDLDHAAATVREALLNGPHS